MQSDPVRNRLEAKTFCAAPGVPVRATAPQFALRHPAVTGVVVGARSATEVIDDMCDLDRELTADLRNELGAN